MVFINKIVYFFIWFVVFRYKNSPQLSGLSSVWYTSKVNCSLLSLWVWLLVALSGLVQNQLLIPLLYFLSLSLLDIVLKSRGISIASGCYCSQDCFLEQLMPNQISLIRSYNGNFSFMENVVVDYDTIKANLPKISM